MNMVLHDLAPEGAKILAPHGALSGFDPYQGYENLTIDNFFRYFFGPFDKRENSPDDQTNRGFIEAFGIPKQTRSGSDIHKSLESPLLNYRHGENTFAELAMQRTL